jgi:heavy metal efflux system protein
VHLPAGYYVACGGQFHNMERALHHLMIIVPITIAAIFFLLFILFHSVRFAALIINVLPLASIGGILGLFLSGEYLWVPASVGFIAVWGIAVLNGVVLLSYIRKLREHGMSQTDAVREGRAAVQAGDDDGDCRGAWPRTVPVLRRGLDPRSSVLWRSS